MQLAALLLAVVLPNQTHEVEIFGLIAREQTEMLSERDKRAAAQAEREALDRDQPIQSFEWEGPDGARGFIIVGAEFPNHFAMGRCRDFIHIIRHPQDGGVNPTFRATVCRDWEGNWRARSKP